MATSTWKLTSGTANWSTVTDWSPAAPVAGDDVFIGSSSDTGNVIVNENVTLTINSLTMAAKTGSKSNTTTLAVTPSATLSVTGSILLGANTAISGTGTLVANGTITGSGKITASSGLLVLSGNGSISGAGPTFAIGTSTSSTLELNLSGGITTGAITINNNKQRLEIGPQGSVVLTQKEQIVAGAIQMAGGVVSDVSGLSFGNGSVGGTLFGFGTVNAPLSSSGSGTSTIKAAGGTLDLSGSVDGSLQLAIDTTSAADLKIDGTAVQNKAISINNTNQTLEIGPIGSLAVNAVQNVSGGRIRLDGGTLTDSAGITLGSAAASGTVSGSGTVNAKFSVSGSSTVNSVIASGGTLDLRGSVAGAIRLGIDSSGPADLKIDGSATQNQAILINSAYQTLEIGTAGSLTINAAQNVGAGKVQLDGGTLTDNQGITLGSGTTNATLIGRGTVNAGLAVSGSGTANLVEAQGGVLDLKGTVGNGLILAIDSAAPAVLKIDGGAVSGNAIVIGNANQKLEIGPTGNLTITTAEGISNGTIQLDGGLLTDASGVAIGAGALLTGQGTAGAITLAGGTVAQSGGALSLASIAGYGTVNGNPTLSGAITASGGLLDLTGALTSALAVDTVAASDLKIDGTVSTGAIVINSANQKLEIGPTGRLTITVAETATSGTIQLDGGMLSDASGVTVGTGASLIGTGTGGAITLAGGVVTQSGGPLNLASITGIGVVNGNPIVTGAITASGGILDVTGAPTGSAAIDTAAGSNLKIDGSFSTGAIAINNANQTLEVGPAGSLTITAAETVTNGTIQLDGGMLIDASGLTLGTGAALKGSGTAGAITLAGGAITPSGGALNLSSVTGFGVVDGSPVVSGAVTASGGVLNLTGDISLAGTAYRIGTANGSVLELSGAAAGGTTFTFTGAAGKLELADLVNGVAQFNGTVAGLGAGNAINIQHHVTGATISGNTLTVVDGTNTVATLQLSNAPGAGVTPTVVADATLGGYDVSLSSAPGTTGGPGPYSHIIVVVEENHSYNQIIGSSSAPYINTLAAGGAVLSDYYAVAHPSLPDYLALYAGSTFGVTDSNFHAEPDPTLDTILAATGRTFKGYVETPNTDQNHDPWSYFPEGTSVETDFNNGFNTLFPTNDFSSLPTLSFVIPNVNDDMHTGTVTQADSWLQSNLDAYAQWASNNNSLLVVTWDENDGSGNNQVPTILYGADVAAGFYDKFYNHYDLLNTILGAYDLTAPNSAANAPEIQAFGLAGSTPAQGTTVAGNVVGPFFLGTQDNALNITGTGTVRSAGGLQDAIDGAATTAWTIVNAGVVSSTAGKGIALAGAGVITNTGSVTALTDYGVRFGGNGSVTNAGVISGKDGLGFLTGGTVLNNGGGLISGIGPSGSGVFMTGATGSVQNYGGISATDVGVDLHAAGSVTNNVGGYITGGDAGVFTTGAAANVVNAGLIQANGTNGAGIYLETGGNVTNQSTGVVLATKFGVFLEGAFTTLANYGSISAPNYDGVVLGLGGIVSNAANAHIVGGHNGVYVKYRATGTVINNGNIAANASGGAGLDLAHGGVVTNNASGAITGGASGYGVGIFITGAAGSVANSGYIGGVHGIGFAAGGTAENGSGGAIEGQSAGIFAQSAAVTVTNNGDIAASATSGAGVDIEAGGSVTNNPGASISGGSFGVFSVGGPGVLNNYGNISGGHGVGLQAGGSLTNAVGASISGSTAGVSSSAGGATITNSGSITAIGGAGADIEGGGVIINKAAAVLSGSSFGVFLAGGSGTVENSGTISGGSYAIDFADSLGDRLIIHPGAVFVGNVKGGSGTNTLELTSGAGSIGGIGTGFVKYSGFQSGVVDAGADWTLTGSGNSIQDLLNNGILDIAGSLVVSTAVDSSSIGSFALEQNAVFEVAAAQEGSTPIGFGGGRTLVIDDTNLFGLHPDPSTYTGPQLQQFTFNDVIDLKNFGSASAAFTYDATNGQLQLSNGSQTATLNFQDSTLGSRNFHLAGDLGTGTFVTVTA